MQDCVTITLDLTVEDDQVEATVQDMQERIQRVGPIPMDGEITVTKLPADAEPQPPRRVVTRHWPC